MGVKFGTEEGTFGPLLRAKFHPHRCNVSPLRGEKPQNRPLSKLNTGRFALRAMLPVKRRDLWWWGLLKVTGNVVASQSTRVVIHVSQKLRIYLVLFSRYSEIFVEYSIFSYHIRIWRPSWGLPDWNFSNTVGTRKTLCLKKVPTFWLPVTLSKLNRFSKFLHCWKAYEICYKIHMTIPTSP